MSRAPFQIYQDQSVDALPSPSRRRPVRGLQVRQPEPQPGNQRPQNSPNLRRIGLQVFEEEYFEPSFDSTAEDEYVPLRALGGIPLEYAANHPIQPRGPNPTFTPPPFEIYEDPNMSLGREGILPGIRMVDWFHPIEQGPSRPQIPHRHVMFQLLEATGPKRKGRRAPQRPAPNLSVFHEDDERRQSNAYRQPRATPARAQQRAPMAQQEVRQTPSQRRAPAGRTPQRKPLLSPLSLEEMYQMQEELRYTRDMDRELLGLKRPYEEERSPEVRPFPARETPRRNVKRSERDMTQGDYSAPPQTSSPARTMGNLNWDEMQMSPLTLEQLVWIRQGAGSEGQGPQEQGGSPMRATSSRSETRICLDIRSGAATNTPRGTAAQHLPSCSRRNDFSPVNTERPQGKSNTPYRPRPEKRAGEEEEVSGPDSTLGCSWQTISETMLTTSDGSELYEERSFDTLVIRSEGCPTPEVMRGEDENESPYSMIHREEGQMRDSSRNTRQRDFSGGSDGDLVPMPHNASANISMASLHMEEVPVGPPPPPPLPDVSPYNSADELGLKGSNRQTNSPRASPQRMSPQANPGRNAAPQTPQGSAQGKIPASGRGAADWISGTVLDYLDPKKISKTFLESCLKGTPKEPASARKTKQGDENIRLLLHACAIHKSERANPRCTATSQSIEQLQPESASRSPQRVKQERVPDGNEEEGPSMGSPIPPPPSPEGCPTPEVMRGGVDENESPYSMIDRKEGQMRRSSRNTRQRDLSAGSDDDLVPMPHNLCINISMASLHMEKVPEGPSPPPPSIPDDSPYNSVEDVRANMRTQSPRGSPQRMPPVRNAAPQTPRGSAQGNTPASARCAADWISGTVLDYLDPKKFSKTFLESCPEMHFNAFSTRQQRTAGECPRCSPPQMQGPASPRQTRSPRVSPQRIPPQEDPGRNAAPQTPQGSAQGNTPARDTAEWIKGTFFEYMDTSRLPKRLLDAFPELRSNTFAASREQSAQDECPVCSPLQMQGPPSSQDYNYKYDRNQRDRQPVRGVQSTGKKVQPLRVQRIPKKPASARKTKPGDENTRLHLHACATRKSERATPRRAAPSQPVERPQLESARRFPQREQPRFPRRSPQRVAKEQVPDGNEEQEESPQRKLLNLARGAADWISGTVLDYMDPNKFSKTFLESCPELRSNYYATREPRTPETCPVCSPLHMQGPPMGSPIPPPPSPEDISPIRGGEYGELEGYRQADYYSEEGQMPPTQWISPGLDYTYEYQSPQPGCFSDYLHSLVHSRPGDKVTLPERRRVLVTRETAEKKKKKNIERQAEMERGVTQLRKERAAKEIIKKNDPTPIQEVDELEKCLSEFLAAQSSWMTWRADMPVAELEKKDGDLQERIIPSDTTPPEDQRVKSEMLNTEFMYYAALLKKHSPNVKDKNTRNCLAKWAKKLFGPEYHVKIEFQEKRNRYLMALTIGVMSNNLLKIFRDSPRPGRLGDPDFKLEPKTVARWEKDTLWNDVLKGLPDPGVLEKPCGQHGDEICPESRAAKSGLDGKRGSNTKEKDLKESALLDKEYRFLLHLAKELAIKLEDPYEKTTAAVWLHALSGVADDATAEKYARREEMAEKYGKTVENWPCPLKRGVRNDYLQALLPYLLESRLDAPFLRGPPDNGDGGPLLNLKHFVPWSTNGERNLSPTSTLADKFLFKQPVPKEGAFAFVALSGDSLNLWFPDCEEQGDDGDNKDAGTVITTTRSQMTLEFEETYNPEG